jgi:hypothetical protein
MGKCIGYEACPKCTLAGRDRRGDNLARYGDASAHCFSCGYHIHPKYYVREVKEEHGTENKAVLPSDFTREIPAACWKWLLQYGLPYSYWKEFTGYSPAEERLVLTVGRPVRFSIGRYIAGSGGKGTEANRQAPRKWRLYGEGHGYVEVLGRVDEGPGRIVLVEDIISWHKVAQVAPCVCLFGTGVHNEAFKILNKHKMPVIIWLDADQRSLLAPKINRLQTFLNVPVTWITTEKDPKGYSLEEIKSIVG